jgi:hypothetical protein
MTTKKKLTKLLPSKNGYNNMRKFVVYSHDGRHLITSEHLFVAEVYIHGKASDYFAIFASNRIQISESFSSLYLATEKLKGFLAAEDPPYYFMPKSDQ